MVRNANNWRLPACFSLHEQVSKLIFAKVCCGGVASNSLWY